MKEIVKTGGQRCTLKSFIIMRPGINNAASRGGLHNVATVLRGLAGVFAETH